MSLIGDTVDLLFRMKVQCLTCGDYFYKRDCDCYEYETWAGTNKEYECYICKVTRPLEGKPLKLREKDCVRS